MAGIDSLDGTLYYQWLINNNSTSTMLNAISGTDSLQGVSGLALRGLVLPAYCRALCLG